MKFLAQYIYQLLLHTNNRILEKFLLLARKLILKISNPIITLSYNNIKLAMPFSHTLPLNQKTYPTYDMQLHSIAHHIYSKDGKLNMIDVGANIGDTAVLTNMPNASYLLIEGEKSYANLIKTNISYNFHKATIRNISMGGGHNKNLPLNPAETLPLFIISHTFLGDNDEQSAYTISLQDGSGKLINDKHNSSVQIQTLDSVVSKADFSPNFIKIDTDGFDFKVLRGAFKTLTYFKPTIFFEWDKNHLQAQNEDFLSIFPKLNKLGYEQLLIFDNFGVLLCVLQSDDYNNLELLMNYTQDSRQNIYYYDILTFHKDSSFNPTEWLKQKNRI